MTAGRIAFAHYLDNHSYLAWAFLIAVFFWFVAAAGIMRARRPELVSKQSDAHAMGAIGALGFFAAIGSTFVEQGFIERAGLAEVHPRLFSTVTAVTVDGSPARDAAKLAAVLREMHHVGAHHSHPLASHRIILQTANGRLFLDIARDAYNPTELWVFNPTFSENTEIGRTFATNLIDIPLD